MAYLFGDSFDFYGSVADLGTRWTLSANLPVLQPPSATAFGVGQGVGAYGGASASSMTANFATNEATIYGSVRLKWAGGGNNSHNFAMTFLDGSNSQCTIQWNSDGSIGLYSGASGGTLLQTYAGAFSLGSWDSWQFKVVINNTAGSIELRKNGVTADTYSLTNVNTRLGSANAYANAVKLGWDNNASYMLVDDVYFNNASGAVPNNWVGDMRAVQATAASATQSQFTTSGANLVDSSGTASASISDGYGANTATFVKVTPNHSGTCGAVEGVFGIAYTAHVIAGLYADNAGSPGALLSASAVVTNPAAGVQSFTLTTPQTVAAGASYWVAFLGDATIGLRENSVKANNISATLSTAYSGGMPASGAAAGLQTSSVGFPWAGMVLTGNGAFVSDLLGDDDGSYIYSSTVGQEDIYTISAIPTSYAVVGVNYLALVRKSDAGSRTALLTVQSNGSVEFNEKSLTPGLSYSYMAAYLAVDTTAAAWTPTTVNGSKIGIKVSA